MKVSRSNLFHLQWAFIILHYCLFVKAILKLVQLPLKKGWVLIVLSLLVNKKNRFVDGSMKTIL